MRHLVIGQHQRAPYFSAFHWSPHGSLVSIGRNLITKRVVHLPKRTKTTLITESDQSGPNHKLLQPCTARLDQAVWAAHSWLYYELKKLATSSDIPAPDHFTDTRASESSV